ncbi:MAG: uracil-DNA glycosylase [Anaerolineales bacterium]|jgi:uracil-DNA glycosylase family 4
MTTLQILNEEVTSCRRCPRLVDWREKVAREKRRAFQAWDYWGKPVPGFGDPQARVLVVGLAPGAHGSNRTGRMFTGDASGDFLFPALYRAGFASQATSLHRGDGLRLKDLYITAVCRCAPPDNKPSMLEMANCQPYLLQEIEHLDPKIFVALGRIAFDRLVRILPIQDDLPVFAHGVSYRIAKDKTLVCSYHPSRQNTQTGRLTSAMFDQIWDKVRELLRR